jgi:hypothetical protein
MATYKLTIEDLNDLNDDLVKVDNDLNDLVGWGITPTLAVGLFDSSNVEQLVGKKWRTLGRYDSPEVRASLTSEEMALIRPHYEDHIKGREEVEDSNNEWRNWGHLRASGC